MGHDYIIINGQLRQVDNELYHYGVLGMKWGQHRAARKMASNKRLERKVLKWDKKAAKYEMKSEKAHAKYDLGFSNRQAIKAAKLSKKAAAKKMKALKATDDIKKLKYETQAAKLEMKAARKKEQSNAVSKSVGYGEKALKYSLRSEKFKRKAAKGRYKITKNKKYIALMNKRMSELSPEKRAKVEQTLSSYIKEKVMSTSSSNKK